MAKIERVVTGKEIGPITITIRMERGFNLRLKLFLGLLRAIAPICPVPIDIELLPTKVKELVWKDGLPQEAAVSEGHGVPVYWLGSEFDIKLDDLRIDGCVAYSIPKGWIERQVTDEMGNVRYDRSRGEVITEKLYGKVVLHRHDSAEAR